jgi:hypothetical protein
MTAPNWRKQIRQRMKTLDWERARADVRPFLERERDLDLVSKEILGKLLGGIWGKVDVSRPFDKALLAVDLSEELRVPQSCEHAEEMRVSKFDLAAKAIRKTDGEPARGKRGDLDDMVAIHGTARTSGRSCRKTC